MSKSEKVGTPSPAIAPNVSKLIELNDVEFISAAVPQFLGRPAAPEELRRYLGQIQSGRNRLDILLELKSLKNGLNDQLYDAKPRSRTTLQRIRHTPLFKQIIDVIILPWVASEKLQQIDCLEDSIRGFELQRQLDQAMLEQSIRGMHTTVSSMIEQAALAASLAASRSSEEVKDLSHELKQVAAELQIVLTKDRSDLSSHVENAAAQVALMVQDMKGEVGNIIFILTSIEETQVQVKLQIDSVISQAGFLLAEQLARHFSSGDKAASDVKAAIANFEVENLRHIRNAHETQAQFFGEAEKAAMDIKAAIANTEVVNLRHIHQVANLLNTSVSQIAANVSAELTARLAVTQQSLEAFRANSTQQALQTTALISSDSSRLAREARIHLAEIQERLSEAQLDISSRLDDLAQSSRLDKTQTRPDKILSESVRQSKRK